MKSLFNSYSEEDQSKNPFQGVRIAQIIKIYDYDSNLSEIDNQRLMFKADVLFLDYGGSTEKENAVRKLQLCYAHISNGYGLQYKPAVGDRVIVAFRLAQIPIILGYISDDYYRCILGKDDRKGYLRNIVEGEYCWKSKQGAEWYLDRKGSLHLIVRDQSNLISYTDKIKDPNAETSNATRVADDVLVDVVIGKVYDSTFTVETKSGNNKSLRVAITDHNKNTKIYVDEDGNVEIDTAGKVQVKSNDIELGKTSLKDAARKDDAVSVTLQTGTVLSGVVVPGGSGSITLSAPLTVNGTITEGSSKVTIAD